MAHTPGPWEMSGDGAEIWPATGENECVELARVVGPWCESSYYDRNTALANGRLISCAPELLSALKSVVRLMASIYDSGKMERTHIIAWRQMLDRIRHVVEKAEGHAR